jgi:hypothetical protein
MASHTRSPTGDATTAFVSWLVTGAVGPALVALPVNVTTDKLASAAVRWFKRYRQTDDLSRLVKAATGTSTGLSRAEIKDLRRLLEDEETWHQLAGNDLIRLTSRVVDCLSRGNGRTPGYARLLDSGALVTIHFAHLPSQALQLPPDPRQGHSPQPAGLVAPCR